MSDLIKRDDAIREVSEPFDEYMWDGVLHPIRYIVDALKAVPSVDAVIVVRCGECKHRDKMMPFCLLFKTVTEDNGYCYKAEREGE